MQQDAKFPSLGTAVRKAAALLTRKGRDAPVLCARLLACKALACSRLDLELYAERLLLPEEEALFAKLVERRARGEPLAYVLGEREFYGRSFVLDPAGLIPRPETELLLDLALARLPASRQRLADLGTGSGCIGISLCAERPAWQALLVDLSAPALGLAAANAQRHGVAGRCLPVRADFCQPLLRAGLFDALVSNPPYVSEAEYAQLSYEVRGFEPHNALVPACKSGQGAGAAGATGLEHLEALALVAADALKAGGLFLAEFGAGQGAAVQALFAARSVWAEVRVHRDLAGLERCVEALRA